MFRVRPSLILIVILTAGCAKPHPAVPGTTLGTPPRPIPSPPPSDSRVPRPPQQAVAALQRDLAAVFGAPLMAHAQWAVAIRSLDTREVLYELNAHKMMMPASNMKIVTLAAAARTLGWDARFATVLETAAPVDAGILYGDLVVRGGGDPTINTRQGRGPAVFAAWIAALKAAGVEEIRGRIVGDDGVFDDEGLGAGWAWDYLQAGYAAPVGALQYNENVADLIVTPGAAVGAPAAVRLSAGTGLTVLSRAVTGPPGVVDTLDYRRHLDEPVLEVTGAVPLVPPGAEGAGEPVPQRFVRRQVAVVNPTTYFVESLREALVAGGVRVTGVAVDIDDIPAEEAPAPGAARRALATTESPPLRDIAAVLMKVSQNLYAETFLKATGLSATGRGTAQAGRAAVLETLREWQLDEGALVMADGSGLSRYNYATADLLVDLLERMYIDDVHRAPFQDALAVAGRDGTMSARMRRTRAEGNARAKTGSISNVRSLSGFVRTRDGEMLGFSILANHFTVPAATVNWITDLAVEMLSNFTRVAPPSAAPRRQ